MMGGTVILACRSETRAQEVRKRVIQGLVAFSYLYSILMA